MPSSVVSSISYEPATATLVVVYVSGHVYHYRQVPLQVYEEMKAARSKGTFLNYNIKGKYRYTKVK